VICLISALAYHQITTQIPHEVYVALKAHSITPRLSHPPIRLFWFTPAAFSAGIDTHKIDGVKVRIYNVEKTLADCFKYRNKLGMDTVLEALTVYRDRKKLRLKQLMEYARICRVENVMRPYVEAKL
jgi:predicted transcriptional regulator of viral defense system